MTSSFLSLSLAVAFLASAAGAAMAQAEPGPFAIERTTTRAVVGVPGKAALTVQGKNGWHINEQAPITLAVSADPTLQLPKPKLARPDLAESTKQTARFEVPFTASTPGKKVITAEAKFVLCQEQACKPTHETVVLNVDVANSGAPAAVAPLKTRGKKTAAARAAAP